MVRLTNIALLMIDDLRPELNVAYDMSQMYTPNLDKFAAEATTFTRAYCQIAVCGPSRNSFMSGRRPDKTRTW
jgi:iduronate 2-sulfatase